MGICASAMECEGAQEAKVVPASVAAPATGAGPVLLGGRSAARRDAHATQELKKATPPAPAPSPSSRDPFEEISVNPGREYASPRSQSPGEGSQQCHKAGWVAKARENPSAAAAVDGTTRFRALLDEAGQDVHTLAKRWDLLYLLVPGLLQFKYPTHLHGTQEHLHNLGLDCRIAEVSAHRSVEDNAAALAELVEVLYSQTDKRVLLVGHSKGGCDSVAAVSRHLACLRGKVAGVVCLQAPLGGSPAADCVEDVGRSGVVAQGIEQALGKDAVLSLRDLTYKRRQQELKDFPFPHKEVPLLTLSTASAQPIIDPSQLSQYMRAGAGGDGVTISADADLPASTRVVVEGAWDHASWASCAPGPASASARMAPLVVEAAAALLVRRVAREGPNPDTFLEPVRAFWHEESGEHRVHLGGPWDGESGGRVVFFAFSRPVPGSEPVRMLQRGGGAGRPRRHAFRCGGPRGEERCCNTVFFAFRSNVAGSEPVHEFFHAGRGEQTLHLGEPWDGEERGEVQFYAFQGAPVCV